MTSQSRDKLGLFRDFNSLAFKLAMCYELETYRVGRSYHQLPPDKIGHGYHGYFSSNSAPKCQKSATSPASFWRPEHGTELKFGGRPAVTHTSLHWKNRNIWTGRSKPRVRHFPSKSTGPKLNKNYHHKYTPYTFWDFFPAEILSWSLSVQNFKF